MTMHRVQAGTLDESGWTLATSTHGAFSVSLPCTFNDFTTEDKDAGGPVKTFTVGCKRADQAKFSATRLQGRNPSVSSEDFVEKNSSGPGEVQTGRHAGLTYVDRALRNATQCAFVRIVLAPPDAILMAVEAPPAECARVEPLAQRLFKSLAVKKPRVPD